MPTLGMNALEIIQATVEPNLVSIDGSVLHRAAEHTEFQLFHDGHHDKYYEYNAEDYSLAVGIDKLNTPSAQFWVQMLVPRGDNEGPDPHDTGDDPYARTYELFSGTIRQPAVARLLRSVPRLHKILKHLTEYIGPDDHQRVKAWLHQEIR